MYPVLMGMAIRMELHHALIRPVPT
eukprot:SAG31_NODE_24578_length_478_cov_1.337731_1_plen_24_part_01